MQPTTETDHPHKYAPVTIRVDTLKYQASHGHKPRQNDGHWGWAFQIDTNHTPVVLKGSYSEALRQAKKLAQYSVTVLP